MKRKIFVINICLVILSASVMAQNSQYYIPPQIFIDTDCGLDDFRVLCMISQIHELGIAGITAVSGIISADEGMIKIKNFLSYNNIESIPIGKSETNKNQLANDLSIPVNFDWGEEEKEGEFTVKSSTQVIQEVLGNSQEGLTFLCMGPLTNLAKVLKENSNAQKKITEIIWYNHQVLGEGFNYIFDSLSAQLVLNSGIPVTLISNTEGITYPEGYYESIKTKSCHSMDRYVQAISSGQINADHKGVYFLWDDLIPIYLLYPRLFNEKTDRTNVWLSVIVHFQKNAVQQAALDLLQGHYNLEQNVALYAIPKDRQCLAYDLRQVSDSIISLHGKDEWRAVLLTNEIHGHLGIYSIVGAKMGILAREYFNAGLDEMIVIAYAGQNPPISCLIDGLQVSTGSTLGQGTISVSPDRPGIPEADFIYNGDTIHIALRSIYKNQVKEDISASIVAYGNLSEGYWQMVRQLGIKYWLEWNRNIIFEITNK